MTTMQDPAPPGAPARPGSSAVAITMVVIAGSFMTVLDTTILGVALDGLSQHFHSPLATIQWTATGYMLALAAVIPLTAWAAGRFGSKHLYIVSVSLFTAGSALAGAAWSTESLIFFRVLQGLGGGMVVPLGMAIVINAAAPEHKGRMMGLLGIPVLVGPLVGPVLGGWLVDAASWRWIFLINVPIGVLTVVLAVLILPRDTVRASHRLDVTGLLTLSPGLAALIYGLATGGESGDFASAKVLVPTLGGAALVVAFVVRALTASAPLLDLRLLRVRAFAAGIGTMALFAGAYFGALMLVPMYYQLVRGESATMSGLLGVPQVLATGITLQIASRLTDRVPAGRIVPIGVTLAVIGYGTFTAQLGPDAPYWRLIVSLTVAGAGVGMTMMPTVTGATRGFAPPQVPAASTLININSQVAGSIGTALLSVLLTTAAAEHGGLAAAQGLDAAARAELAPSLADAFQHTYVWVVVLMAASMIPALCQPRKKYA
ncbi:DHA2 family efflux MFS transporter permease subunit [Streptomyces sp. NBC_01408]|uniref:DHA2 family efflux MFS transporter permease subunit n=1 Tax=Streptomyces sp. NBC_01408 TaxID=2903855 RepID=UPI00225BC93E|nr:DHA2 family efflux MFS transporter permease subunit [Streptomyces sp. NBC_01408]MCX4692329.1 DHA2 family efflux MFS transporter permease subunit [Streptomyces sp. NBC_01408]